MTEAEIREQIARFEEILACEETLSKREAETLEVLTLILQSDLSVRGFEVHDFLIDYAYDDADNVVAAVFLDGPEVRAVASLRAGLADRLITRALEDVRERAWNEADHPREPAGSPQGGQFTEAPGAGGSETAAAKPKGKKKASKDDFKKAKIRIVGNEDVFVAKWNEIVGQDAEEFREGFMGGLDGTMAIEGDPDGIMEVRGSILNNSGVPVGEYRRELSVASKTAKSALFSLKSEVTGTNIGKKMLAGNVETYQELGIEKVKVFANIDVGGYAWAKYGYVPLEHEWDSLRRDLASKVRGREGGAQRAGTDTYEADSWEMLSNDQQQQVYDRWASNSYDEFYSSEVDSWREGSDALESSKRDLASNYSDRISLDWATDAMDKVRENHDIPYTNEQLIEAISIDYSSRYEDGRADADISFDDDRLREPEGFDPAQQTLPGIEPEDPSQRLTDDMRKALNKELAKAFNDKAESMAEDAEPPDYLADSVREYQEEYWSTFDDDQKLREAVSYGLANIEIERDEDEEEAEADEPEELTGMEPRNPLLDALDESDPKAIWRVSDLPGGKSLLLGTSWQGVLNLKDKESMARFKAYINK